MPAKEAKARIKINKLLEESGWRLVDDSNGPANVVLEGKVKITHASADDMGEDFEKTTKGFIDYLLLDERGYPLIKLFLLQEFSLVLINVLPDLIKVFIEFSAIGIGSFSATS